MHFSKLLNMSQLNLLLRMIVLNITAYDLVYKGNCPVDTIPLWNQDIPANAPGMAHQTRGKS